ncbi:site-specific DNA-methyltransferase, partial [bacterium]
MEERFDVLPGQTWTAGRQKLHIGDARDPRAYELLLGTERAVALWTDPPYGVDYQGKTAARMRIQGDGTLQAPLLAMAAFQAANDYLQPGAAIFVCTPCGPLQLRFGEAIEDAGWTIRQQLVWAKNHFALGRQDFHYKHETLWYGRKPGPGRWGRGSQ